MRICDSGWILIYILKSLVEHEEWILGGVKRLLYSYKLDVVNVMTLSDGMEVGYLISKPSVGRSRGFGD